VAQKNWRFFPPERMYRDYPWQIWAVGWLAIFKGLWWLATQPVLPDPILRLLGFKYIIGMLPLVICGIGLWNRKRWSCWGLVVIAAANLLFFVTNAQTLQAYLVQTEFPGLSPVLSLLALLFNGPLGDILILLALPSMRRHCLIPTKASESVYG